MQSVVTISTVRIAIDEFFGLAPVRGVGSGFIIHGKGYIVTNNHVVQGSSTVYVVTSSGETIEADVVATDPYRDLALVKVDAYNLKPIALGDSDKIRVGEIVFAIGSPLGLPGATVTMGVVSAVGRTISGENIILEDLIQTDAAINPGNSGGPLINVNGEAIGVTTAIIPYAQGIGFAIPINTVKRFLEMISRYGKPIVAWIGVYVAPITHEQAKMFRLSISKGLIVVGVVRGGPAYEVGISRGDIIVKANGKEISSPRELRMVVEESIDRGYIELEIVRGSKRYSVEVPIAIHTIQ
uniref:Trypsin-like serine protease n=1 Tax=Ignisphaera aggregans TaxID=334771 RepID=A0A7C5XJ44_9CREN